MTIGFRLARPAALAMVAALGVVSSGLATAQDKDPLAGNWNFVPEKSTFTPGPVRYKSATITFDSGHTVMNLQGVGGDGKPVKATFDAATDGKPHPVTGVSAYDTASWTPNSNVNASYTLMKGKNIVALGTRTLSPDGSTLTFREQLYDRAGKQTGVAVMVFQNPDVKVATVTPAGGGRVVQQTALTPDETAAAAALAKGDDDEAIRLFTKVISANKATPLLYYDYVSRGVAYSKKNQFEQALSDFDEAVKLKPDDVDARFRRGGTRVQLKQYKGAIEDLTTVIQADPMNAAAYSLRAFSHNVMGDDKAAGADYDKACMIDKKFCI